MDEQDFKEPFLNVFIKNKSLEITQYFEKAILGKTQRFNAVGLCKNGENIGYQYHSHSYQ